MTNKKDFLPELLRFLKRSGSLPILKVSREELTAVCKELEVARETIRLMKSIQNELETYRQTGDITWK